MSSLKSRLITEKVVRWETFQRGPNQILHAIQWLAAKSRIPIEHDPINEQDLAEAEDVRNTLETSYKQPL